MTPREQAEYIRSTTNPHDDYQLAVKENDNRVDALERLTYTADMLEDFEYDYLINRLKNRANEIEVLLRRIARVRKEGFQLEAFPNTQS